VPEEDVALVVLANGYGQEGLYASKVWAIGDLVMKTVLPKWSRTVRSSSPEKALETPAPELRGEWRGVLHTYRSDLPFALTFLPSGDVHVRIGAQLPGLLSDVTFSEGWLHGRTTGDLGVEEVDRHSGKYLELLLKLHDQVLSGSVVASTEDRRGFELAHWAQLRKQ
jgi:hypothetical protein